MQKVKYKRIVLRVIELCLVLGLLIGSMGKETLVYSYDGSGVGDRFRSVGMELTPGVYQIKAECNTGEEQSLSVEMKSDTAGYKEILGNSVYVFPGQSFIDFEVYVTGRVSDAYVECAFYGAGPEVLKELTVWRTNWGYRILLFYAVCMIALLELMLYLRKGILEKRISVKSQVVCGALTMGILLAYIPYLTDYFSLGADTGFHLLRIEGLKESLLNGDLFPVRVQSYWMYDHGSVVSSMYGDIFLLFPAILRLIGFPLMSAYKIFVFAVTVATAWIGYASLRKCTQNDYMAVVGSLFYLLAPYRIYNVFARGAEGEYMAMTFLPLICCGMYLLYTANPEEKEYRKHKWWIVAGMSALLLCHPLTAELAAVFMLVVCVVFWRKTFCRQTFVQLVQAVIWVLLLNLWFLVPMMYLLGADQYHLQQEFDKNIQEAGIQWASIFQFWPNKGSGGTTMYGYEPINIGAAGVACLLLFGVMALRDKSYRKRTCLCVGGLTLLALILSTRYFPWNLLSTIPVVKSFVNSLQFPLRIMTMSSALAAMFIVVFMSVFAEKEGRNKTRICTGILVFMMIGTSLYQTGDILLDSGSVRLYTAENMGTTSSWSKNFIFAENEQEEFGYHDPVAEDGLLWTDYEKKGTNIRITVRNESLEEKCLELPLMGYKGYAVEAVAKEGEVPVVDKTRGAHGDLKISVPGGYEGELTISYKGLWLFTVVEWISILSLIGLCVKEWLVYRKGEKHGIASRQR